MADPNDPWAAFNPQDAPQAAPFGGRPVIQEGPKTASPQTDEQRANTIANTDQSRTSIKNTGFDNVNNLRKQFESEQAVQDYKTVLPLMDSALKIKNNKAGDLNLVYAFGKVMDPNSVVREGEQVMATNVGGVSEKVKGYLSQIEGQGGLTPIQRTQLTEEIRSRTISLGQTYNQRRTFYEDFAHRNGINPEDVTGPNPGSPFVSDEKSYIVQHGGTPKIGGVPTDPSVAPPTKTEGHFGDQPDNTPHGPAHAQEFHDQLYSALASKQLKSVGQVNDWVRQFNQRNGTGFQMAITKSTRDAISNAARGKAFDVETPIDPRAQKIAQQYIDKGSGRGAALTVGAADAASLGSTDEIGGAGSAFMGAMQGKGSFGDLYGVNTDATRIYEDFLQKTHPGFYAGGQVIGSLALPTGGASTAGEMARAGAALGGAYGFNSGRDTLGNRAVGAIEGAAAGGATGYAIPKGIQVARNALSPRTTAVPPLVDSMTGQLNQPLEAMSPGQRVVKAEEYGINLPADAAGGRTAAVIGKGLDIMPGSAGVMEDARRATENQVTAASDVVASRFGNSRTMNEAGAELQRGANERIDRGKATIDKAYQAIPISDKAQTTLTNTTNTLQRLTGRFESNPTLANALRDGKLGTYLGALQKGGLSWEDLKDFRSLIGEKIGDMRFGEGHSISDLRALYGALSEDMRNTASAQGPGALRAFERANSLNRQNEQLIEGALTRLLGKDGQLAPEKAAAAVQAMTKGGKSTGDLKTLAQIRSATIKSGAWDEIAATLIRLGGQPANSAGRDFNPTTFVHWYGDMSEQARRMLFGSTDLRSALDGFVAVNQRLMKVNALRNTSNTAGTMTAAGTVGTMAAAITDPMLGAKLLGVMAGNFGMAKLWTNPAFVRLMTGYSRAVASGSSGAIRSQIGRLSKLAATNPDLREPLIALQQRLANDNYTPSVAASSSDQTDENQQR